MTWRGPLVNLSRGPFRAHFWNFFFHAKCLVCSGFKWINPLPCRRKNTLGLILGQAKNTSLVNRQIFGKMGKLMCGIGVFLGSPLFSSIGQNFTPKCPNPYFRGVLNHMAKKKNSTKRKDVNSWFFVFTELLHDTESYRKPIFSQRFQRLGSNKQHTRRKEFQKMEISVIFCWFAVFMFVMLIRGSTAAKRTGPNLSWP